MIKVKLLARSVPVDDSKSMASLLSAMKRYTQDYNDVYSILNEQSPSEVKKRLVSALKARHYGIFEHMVFTFEITGSRIMTHQMVRHRIASFLQKSNRTLDVTKMGFLMPDMSEENIEEALEFLKMCDDFFYQLIESGVSRDDARRFYPHGVGTGIIITINCRALMHFLKLRLSSKANWEIRYIANEMLKIAKQHMPYIFEKEMMEYWEN